MPNKLTFNVPAIKIQEIEVDAEQIYNIFKQEIKKNWDEGRSVYFDDLRVWNSTRAAQYDLKNYDCCMYAVLFFRNCVYFHNNMEFIKLINEVLPSDFNLITSSYFYQDQSHSSYFYENTTKNYILVELSKYIYGKHFELLNQEATENPSSDC